ncbi:hypothetical protein HN51_065327, partial [Arachis hypogaea]
LPPTNVGASLSRVEASASRVEAALTDRSVAVTVTEALASSGRRLGIVVVVGLLSSLSLERWSSPGSGLLWSPAMSTSIFLFFN